MAISLVLFDHLVGTRHFPLGQGFIDLIYAHPFLLGDPGRLGVRIFFVISGFLITTLLLEEFAGSGRISVPLFYFRRTLRIFPAAYAFVIVIFVLHKFGLIPHLLTLQRGDLLPALTYTMNYDLGRSWPVAHLWSLSVEEQFYLLWAGGLALLGPIKGLRLALGCVFAAPLFRAATYFLLPGWREYIDLAFPTVCDSLAVGCALALMRSRLEQHPGYMTRLSSRALLGLPFAILALNNIEEVRFHGVRVFATVGETLVYLLIALWIHRSVSISNDGMGRFLNWRPLKYMGQLSYSLYIWQQIFLNRTSSDFLAAFPLNLICTAGAGLASYYLVESPFLELRSRLESAWRRKTLLSAQRELDSRLQSRPHGEPSSHAREALGAPSRE